jgi:transcriptional regulator with XRE-family HTH domain
MSLGNRIRGLRSKKNLTQLEVARQLNMGRSNFGHIENDRVIPNSNDLDKIANILDSTSDYLLGRTNDSQTPYLNEVTLTPKDNRDIAKDLEELLAALESNVALAFNGEPMDDETKRLFHISLENSMRLAKEMAKQKFTPNKYRH